MTVRRALATLLLSTLAAAAEQRAPAPAAPAAPGTMAPGASIAPAGSPSLERLVQLVAEDVRAYKPEPPVALHLSATSAELQRATGTLLAARLSFNQQAPLVLDAPSPEAAEALARERGARSLLRLTISVQEGQLTARGDLLGTWVNFWSGRTPSRPSIPAAAVVRAVEADAGALALAALSPLTAPSPSMAVATGPRQVRLMGAVLVRLEQVPAALATGDLDGDGKDEVAVLTERAVSVFAADGRMLARRDLDGLPLSPAPPREPFGVMAIIPQPARLAVWSARYAHGEVLVFDPAKSSLRPSGPLDTAPLGATERATFTSASIVPPRMLFVHLDGSASLYSRPTVPPLRIPGIGAGSALGDLDGDGTPELIATSPQLFPAPDVVRVYALTGDDPTTHGVLWQSTLPPGRAFHVVTADLDRDNHREVLVGLWHPDGTGEVFLMRQGAP
jgi:FG-GAP repeat